MPNGTKQSEGKLIGLAKPLLILAIILVAGQMVSWGVGAYSTIWGTTGNYPREISVTAQGKAVSVPDVAIVRVGVKTEGMKVAVVAKENNEKMNAILASLKDLGIAQKDIQTINYSLIPQYDYTDKGERVFKGYALSQEIKIKIRDFAVAGDVLEKSTGLGANLVGDLQFTIDDPAIAKAAALQDAITKAKAKAQEISSASGLNLKKIINIYEDYNQTPQYSSSVGMGGGEALMKAAPAVAPDIQAGEQEITANVTLVYRVK
ncbi:MAG: SIMPL domain-containing protein [Candidatus Gribaldobacteria bacterium]|nr:SIMPL domain-containing protein [Candidatus Gribaldobacteria bacterium]